MITAYVLDALLVFLIPMSNGLPVERTRDVYGIYKSEKACMQVYYEEVDYMTDMHDARLIRTIPGTPCKPKKVKASELK